MQLEQAQHKHDSMTKVVWPTIYSLKSHVGSYRLAGQARQHFPQLSRSLGVRVWSLGFSRK